MYIVLTNIYVTSEQGEAGTAAELSSNTISLPLYASVCLCCVKYEYLQRQA